MTGKFYSSIIIKLKFTFTKQSGEKSYMKDENHTGKGEMNKTTSIICKKYGF